MQDQLEKIREIGRKMGKTDEEIDREIAIGRKNAISGKISAQIAVTQMFMRGDNTAAKEIGRLCPYPDEKKRERLNAYFQSDEYKQFIEDLAKHSNEPPEFVKNTKCIVQIPYELAKRKDFDMKAYMLDCFRNHPERITYKTEKKYGNDGRV